jgi:hypothetical protein
MGRIATPVGTCRPQTRARQRHDNPIVVAEITTCNRLALLQLYNARRASAFGVLIAQVSRRGLPACRRAE